MVSFNPTLIIWQCSWFAYGTRSVDIHWITENARRQKAQCLLLLLSNKIGRGALGGHSVGLGAICRVHIAHPCIMLAGGLGCAQLGTGLSRTWHEAFLCPQLDIPPPHTFAAQYIHIFWIKTKGLASCSCVLISHPENKAIVMQNDFWTLIVPHKMKRGMIRPWQARI